MDGSIDKDLRAGGTSGKTERESYACISFSISESERISDDSAKACSRERRVTSEKGLKSNMLFRRHVYSSWYRLHSAATNSAFSLPKWVANSLAILSVERSVPYKSNAITVLLPEAMLGLRVNTARLQTRSSKLRSC